MASSLLVYTEEDLKNSTLAEMHTKLKNAYEIQKQALETERDNAKTAGETEHASACQQELDKLAQVYRKQYQEITAWYKAQLQKEAAG